MQSSQYLRHVAQVPRDQSSALSRSLWAPEHTWLAYMLHADNHTYTLKWIQKSLKHICEEHACVWTCLWQQEDKLGCWASPSALFLLLCTLGWPPASRESPVPISHLFLGAKGLQAHPAMMAFCGFCGSDLGSSCLRRKNLTHWTIACPFHHPPEMCT